MHRVFQLLSIVLIAHGPAPRISAQDHFFVSGGVRIRYLDKGSGSAVILLHGYAGSADSHWVNPGLVDKLATDHRVIALDLRGHGKSDKPHDPAAYGPELSRDVVRLMDQLDIRRAHLVGYSLGAGIAAQLMCSDPARFETVTLIASGRYRKWDSADDVAAEAAARELESAVPFRSLVIGLTPVDTPAPTEERIRELSRSLVANNDLHALAAIHRARSGLASTDSALFAVGVPVLGVVGSADRNLRAMQQLSEVLHDYHLIVFEGATHGGDRGVLRRPELIDVLRRFIDARQRD